jgi:glycosyltransferase involved in cell wall biosynthesis
MRVLLVHSSYQQFGGEDAVVQAETELLTRHGDPVYVYARDNNEIQQFGLVQKTLFLSQNIYSWRTNDELEDVVRQFRPEVAFVHNVYPLISPAAYHKLHDLQVPIVQVLHNFRPFCPNGLFFTQGRICEDCKGGRYWNAVSKRCYRNSYALSGLYAAVLGLNRMAGMVDKISAFVCLTEFFRDKMIEAGIPRRKLFVRPNFVEAPPLSEPASSEHQSNDGYVLFMGRLSPEKGCWTLVRAMEAAPQIKLKILGTGPMELELGDYLSRKGIRNVELLGFKTGAEKVTLLRNALAVVVPSEWYENFPLTVLEGFMAEKPVIASRIGGLPYIVEDGITGLLFAPGSPGELADKISQLAQHPDLAAAMGKRARLLSETKYSPEQGYKNLVSIFSQVQAAAQAA